MRRPQVLRKHKDKVNLLMLLSDWTQHPQRHACFSLSPESAKILDAPEFNQRILDLGRHEARLRFDVYDASENVYPGPLVMVAWRQEMKRVVYVSEYGHRDGDGDEDFLVRSSARSMHQMFAGMKAPASDEVEKEVDAVLATVLRNCVIDLCAVLKNRRQMLVRSMTIWHVMEQHSNHPILIGASEIEWTRYDSTVSPPRSAALQGSSVSKSKLPQPERQEEQRHDDQIVALRSSSGWTKKLQRPLSAQGPRAMSKSKKVFLPSSAFPPELSRQSARFSPDDQLIAKRDKQLLRETKHLLFEERKLTAALRQDLQQCKSITKQDEARLLQVNSEATALQRSNSDLTEELKKMRQIDSRRVFEMKQLRERLKKAEAAFEEENAERRRVQADAEEKEENLRVAREELERTAGRYRSESAALHHAKDSLEEKVLLLQKRLQEVSSKLKEKESALDQLQEFHRLCYTMLADLNTPGVVAGKHRGKSKRRGGVGSDVDARKCYPEPRRKNVQIIVKALVDGAQDSENPRETSSLLSSEGTGKSTSTPFGAISRIARRGSRSSRVEDQYT